jgi:hypothetical protein
MNEKILEVVERFIKTPDLIEETAAASGEYYFRSKGHYFSILKRNERTLGKSKYGTYTFYIYPKWDNSLQHLAEVASVDEEGITSVAFHESELPVGLTDPLQDLYETVKGKYANIDHILDDILDEPSF